MPHLQTITFTIGDKSPKSAATDKCPQQQSSFNSLTAASLGTSLLFNINIGKYGGKKLVAVWKCNNQIIPHRRSCYEYRSTRTTIGFLIVSVKPEDTGSWTAELYDLNTLESRSRLPYEFAVQVSRASSGRSSDQKKLNATTAAPPVKEAINGKRTVTRQNDTKTAVKSSINSVQRGTTTVITQHLQPKREISFIIPRIHGGNTSISAPKPSGRNSTNSTTSFKVSSSSKATGPTQVSGQVNPLNVRQFRQESFVKPNPTSTNRPNAPKAQSKLQTIGANTHEERFSARRNATQAPTTINNRSSGYKQNPDCRRTVKASNVANLNRNQSSSKITSPEAEKEQRQLASTTKTSLYPRRLAREPSSAVLVVTGRANAVNNVVNKDRQDALPSSDRVKPNIRFDKVKQSSVRVPAVVLATTTTTIPLEDFNTQEPVQIQQVPKVQIDFVPHKPKMQRAEMNKPQDPPAPNGGAGIKVKPAGNGKISHLINRFNNSHNSSAAATTSTTSEAEKPAKPDRRPVGRLTLPKFTQEKQHSQDGQKVHEIRTHKPKVKLITSPVPPGRSSGDNVPNVEESAPATLIKNVHVPEPEQKPLVVPDQTQLSQVPEEITKDFESTLQSDSSVLEFKEFVKVPPAVEIVIEEEQTPPSELDNPQEIQSHSSVNFGGTADCLVDEPEDSATVNKVAADAGNLIEPQVPLEYMKQPIVVDVNGNETIEIIQEPIAAAPQQAVPIPPKELPKASNSIQERIQVIAKIGERVELTTLSDADDNAEIAPNQEIQWKLPNKQVTTGERNLILENVSFAHSGKYEAVISKRRGSVLRKTFSLNVEGPPDIITSLSISKLQNPPKVEVSWKGCAFDGGSGILHYIVQYNGEEFQTSDVSIKIPLSDYEEATTSHTFQVAAVNKHGRGPWSTIDYCECIEIEDAEKFHDYTKLEELGKGRFGTVSRVEYFGHCYAGKFIKAIRAADREKAKLEVQILSRLRGHERLVNIVAAFQLQREVVILTELLTGGELFERIVADDFHLTEAKCKEFVQEILAGIDHVHSKSIIHLDIKPENILITPTGLKLIDFGLSQIYDPDKKQCVLFGTPEFVSPEIINYEPIGFYCDIWSIGVVTYVLVSGLSPFMGDADSETFANVTLGEFDFDDEAFEQVSPECLDFIRACLTRSPVNRPSTNECIYHPWMLQNSDATIRKDKLKSFVLRRKWQKTGNAIRAIGRLRSYGSFNTDSLNSP